MASFVALLSKIESNFDNPSISVLGYETNPNVINLTIQRINKRFPSVQIAIENRDFLEAVGMGIDHQFDFIIANPPYLRTQILGAEKAQEIAAFVGINGRIDRYYAFLVLAERLLNKGGIAGFITSNKFMTIKAGQSVRRHFVKKTNSYSCRVHINL